MSASRGEDCFLGLAYLGLYRLSVHPGWEGAGSRIARPLGRECDFLGGGLYLEEGLHNSCEFETSLARRMYRCVIEWRWYREAPNWRTGWALYMDILCLPSVSDVVSGFSVSSVWRCLASVRAPFSSQMCVWGGDVRKNFEREKGRIRDLLDQGALFDQASISVCLGSSPFAQKYLAQLGGPGCPCCSRPRRRHMSKFPRPVAGEISNQ